jgi:hypothetical protein
MVLIEPPIFWANALPRFGSLSSYGANIRLRPNIQHDSTGGFQLQII